MHETDLRVSASTGANPLGATSFARCGDVQYCADDHVPVLHPAQGSTLLIDADCGLGKTTAIRRRAAASPLVDHAVHLRLCASLPPSGRRRETVPLPSSELRAA